MKNLKLFDKVSFKTTVAMRKVKKEGIVVEIDEDRKYITVRDDIGILHYVPSNKLILR